jgi:hypothetical protein
MRSCLQLACMPGTQAPEDVVLKLVEINPHALLLLDHHAKSGPETAVHYLCSSIHRHNSELMGTVIAAALQMTKNYPNNNPCRLGHPYTPPLYTACCLYAPAATLEALLQEAPTWLCSGPICDTPGSPFIRSCDRGVSVIWFRVEHDLRNLEDTQLMTIRAKTLRLLGDCKLSVSDKSILDKDSAVNAWLRLFVVLRSKMKRQQCTTIIHLLAQLCWPIDDLFGFICRLFPDDLQTLTVAGESTLQLLLDRKSYLNSHVSLMITTVVKSRPHLLTVRDSVSGEFPFLIAAAKDMDLDCLYGMLVAYPDAFLSSTSGHT